ncbi:MAG: Tad domain-containing protein [Chloroflexota bacterium]
MEARTPAAVEPRGQVLVMFAVMLVVLLAMAGLTIDVGRAIAERRHVQTAADAGALATCRELIAGASQSAAAQVGREVTLANLTHSPAGAQATMAAYGSPLYASAHAGDPSFLRSGLLISDSSVRVAVESVVETFLARVVGVGTLETGAQAQCGFDALPAIPVIARRYTNSPGPGGGFVDNVSTAATSANGQVDATNVMGYDGRTPASLSQPGPDFELYGPGSKANNDSSFRGFIALDVRNFATISSRVYYNGVSAGTQPNTLKAKEADYLLGKYYPGPDFPPVVTPPDPNDQVAVLSGESASQVVHNFDDVYSVGDRVLLTVYDGTVMTIPDFSITPPSEIVVPATGTSTGPDFTVSRNKEFSSTVTLYLRGDHAGGAINPAWDLIPVAGTAAPAAGEMNEPTFTPQTFIPATQGTRVGMTGLKTNAAPVGIYTIWLEGLSGNPYFQTRRQPVPVRVGGAARDFSLTYSSLYADIAAIGGGAALPIRVTTATGSSGWGTGSSVALSVDASSFETCGHTAAAIAPGQLTLSAPSVTPTATNQPAKAAAVSTLNINSAGLAAGCYSFNLRGTGTNGAGQPVVHLASVSFTVATSTSSGSYVDIIGFAAFEITDIGANNITAHAISAVYANPADQGLRSVQVARLLPW